MRSSVRVTGCKPPVPRPRPGRVTSSASAASFCSSLFCCNASRRCCKADSMPCLTWLMRAPAAGRSSADSLPKPLSKTVRLPSLPRYFALTCSNSASSLITANCRRARSRICWSSCIYNTTTQKGMPQTKKEAYRLLCFSSLRLNAEAGFSLHHELCKRCLVEHRDVRQYLAINLNIRFLQAIHEHAVGQSLFARGCIDTRDPQGAELALLLTAIAVRILSRFHHRLFGDTVDVLAATAISLGLRQYPLMAGACCYSTFYSWHGLLLMRKASWREPMLYWLRGLQSYRATDVCSWWSSWSGYGA